MIIGADTAGIAALARTFQELIPECAAEVRGVLVAGGNEIRDEAASMFQTDARIMPTGGASAAGFTTRVRTGAIVRVEQSKRKTTGRRPDFGALQVTHALLPARDAKLAGVVAGIEGGIAAVFEAHSA